MAFAYNAPPRPYDDLKGYLRDRLERRDAPDRMVAQGEQLAAAIAEKDSPLSILLDQLREEMGDAALELIDADLFSDIGIQTARASQAKALRFVQLIELISTKIETAKHFEEAGIDRLVEEQEAQIKELWDAPGTSRDS